ncbi:hypothetical protein ACIOMP_08650 [Pseudomonas protegens]|uniref:hypothetical protein n=1 Tax=Pseudomonas protegens TaxID=380021 RepID=UPI0038049A92
MSQFDYGTIDPNAKSGPQLALDLNQFRDALNSGHRGATRPPYARSGMSWVQEVSGERWDLMFFDGATDYLLRSINPQTGKLLPIPQENVQGLVDLGQAVEKNTAPMIGATATAEGKKGLVPVPSAGDSDRYLSTDGTFRAVNKATLGITALETTQANHSGRISALENNRAFSKSFTSDDQVITAGGWLTLAHRLGGWPTLWARYLVCKDPEHGYWAGAYTDTIGASDYAYSLGVSIVPDATSIYCRFGSQSSVFYVLHWDTGNVVSITPSKWRLVVRAWA